MTDPIETDDATFTETGDRARAQTVSRRTWRREKRRVQPYRHRTDHVAAFERFAVRLGDGQEEKFARGTVQ